MITTTLAAFPSPAQGVWHLGPVPIRAYAVCIIVGIIAALLIGDRRWAARGGERGVIYDIALWAVPFGLLGGRLYHVLTDWKTYFGPGGAGPIAALRIWDGGLGIWGAVALGAVGAWIGCRRRGIPLPAFGDAIAPGIVLAQAIGRLGNYFNQELYGRETTVPWGMEIFYRRDPSGIVDVHSLNGVSTGEIAAVVHPTFLYELLWNLLVFVLLLLIDRWWKMGHGRLFATYVALYCVGRFCVELLRDDTATHLAGIRINSYTSVFVFLGAVVYIILAPKGREDPSLLRGRDIDDDGVLAPELADELVAVAGGTGVVAAARVAGAEDVGYDADEPPPADADAAADDGEDEAGAEAPVEEPEEPEDEPVDVESVSEPAAEDMVEQLVEDQAETEAEVEGRRLDADPDEAILEAESVGTGIEVESDAEAEELIDDDHDPVDDPDFEDFLGEDDRAEPDVDESAPAGVAPVLIDATIDEAVAVEQVTDPDDGEHAEPAVDNADVQADDAAMVVIDPVETDASMVVTGEDSSEGTDAAVSEDTDAAEAEPDAATPMAGEPTDASPGPAAADPEPVDEPEKSPSTDGGDGGPERRSRLGRLFRR